MVIIVKIIFSQQWYNHGSSLKLEAETRKKIDQKIHEKVNNNIGTWIDWQYLLDAAALLAKVHECASSFLAFLSVSVKIQYICCEISETVEMCMGVCNEPYWCA